MDRSEDQNEVAERRPKGYAHLALCILDAVWSPGVNGTTVRNVISRYCLFAALPDPFSELAPHTAKSDRTPAEPLRRFVEAVERDSPEGVR